MWLQIKLSNDEACTHALLKLIASAIKNVTRCWLFKLSNNCCHHKESQSDNEDDDENEALEAI